MCPEMCAQPCRKVHVKSYRHVLRHVGARGQDESLHMVMMGLCHLIVHCYDGSVASKGMETVPAGPSRSDSEGRRDWPAADRLANLCPHTRLHTHMQLRQDLLKYMACACVRACTRACLRSHGPNLCARRRACAMHMHAYMHAPVGHGL